MLWGFLLSLILFDLLEIDILANLVIYSRRGVLLGLNDGHIALVLGGVLTLLLIVKRIGRVLIHLVEHLLLDTL